MKQSSCNKQWTEQHTIKTQPPKNCIKSVGTQRKIREKKNKIKKSQLKPKTKRKTTKLISNSNLLSTRRHVVKAKAERGGWDSECEWEKSHSFDCFLEVQFIMNFMNMKFAVIYLLLCLSLSFTVKRSKFSLATSSSSSLSKSSINVEANKNSRHELQPTPVGSFLSGLWSGLV